jgi:hypothetical protein
MEIEKAKVLMAAKSLNESKLAPFQIKVVAVKTEDLVKMFMAGVEGIKEEDEEKAPDIVGDVFNALRDEEDAGTLGFDRTYIHPGTSPTQTSENTKKPVSAKEPPSAGKEDVAATDAEKKKNNLPVREKDAFGRVVDTMSGMFSAMLVKGSKLEPIVKAVAKKYGRTEEKVAGNLKGHMAKLKKEGYVITLKDETYTLSLPEGA